MRYILLKICLVVAFDSIAQEQQRKDYPQNYFRNPLSIPIVLAGNFGECRPNHFHSGLDIKTNSKENYPVYAAADGYVSRIRMDKAGFGHALYLTHPNGYTTLYAHLNDFAPPIQRYLRQKQYELESWSVDLALTPEQFPVKKGQQIAWSGNTGGSTAPHLHFEIRNTQTEHPLNPQLFGFQITDTRPPVPKQIALYNLNQSIYEQQAELVSLQQSGNYYIAPGIISVNTNTAGVGVHVNDFMNGSDNTLNFHTASWFVDDSLQGTIRLDDIGYDVTRYLHAYIDYKIRKQNNNWYQLLFMLPGNQLNNIYPILNDAKGAIKLPDDQPHKVRIELTDAAGNNTRIMFDVKSTGVAPANECNIMFNASNFNSYEHTNVKFTLQETDLYDNICFRFDSITDMKSLSDRYKIHTPLVPVHNFFDLHIKPNKLVPFNLRDKVVLMYSDGKTESGKAAGFDNGWYKAAIRNFGTYWLITDTIAPVIKPLQPQGADLSKAKQLSISVKENITSVALFRAALISSGKPDQWLSFEPKGDAFFYTFDEYCPRGNNTLRITVRDENGNQSMLNYNFGR